MYPEHPGERSSVPASCCQSEPAADYRSQQAVEGGTGSGHRMPCSATMALLLAATAMVTLCKQQGSEHRGCHRDGLRAGGVRCRAKDSLLCWVSGAFAKAASSWQPRELSGTGRGDMEAVAYSGAPNAHSATIRTRICPSCPGWQDKLHKKWGCG